MSWKPTEGLRRSESVVQQILNDLVACGVPPITNPDARWRMKQVIAQALDGFRSTIEPEFPLEERDDPPYPNGSDDEPSNLLVVPPGGNRVYGAPGGPHATIAEALDAITPPAKKRSRGRPKLSAAEKKKRKAAKQANAVEAEAAT